MLQIDLFVPDLKSHEAGDLKESARWYEEAGRVSFSTPLSGQRAKIH